MVRRYFRHRISSQREHHGLWPICTLYGTGQTIQIAKTWPLKALCQIIAASLAQTVEFNGSNTQSINPLLGHYTFDNVNISNTSYGVSVNATNYIEIDAILRETECLTVEVLPYILQAILTMTANSFNMGTSTFILYAGINSNNGRNDGNMFNQQQFYILWLKIIMPGSSNVTVTYNIDFEGALVSNYGNIKLGSYNLIIAPGATLRWGGSPGPISVLPWKRKDMSITDSTGTMNMTASTNGTLWANRRFKCWIYTAYPHSRFRNASWGRQDKIRGK